MTLPTNSNRQVPRIWALLYALLDPIPYGFFVAAMIFDMIYERTAEVLWVSAAAWLLAMGLVIAIIPRIINLFLCWMPRYSATKGVRFDFLCSAIAIIVAIFNAFVHSRDAYATMPTGMWLSLITVALIVVGRVAGSLSNWHGGSHHEQGV